MWALRHYVAENPFAQRLFSDSHHYFRWATAIASGEPWREPFYQAPLYPHFLAGVLRLTGGSLLPVYLAQLLLGCAAVYLVGRLARLFLSPLAAAAAATLYGLLPDPIYFEQKLVPEPLALPVALLAVLLAARAGRTGRGWGAAGAAAGLASIAKANLLALVVLYGVGAARAGRTSSARFLLAAVLFVAPVTAWNLLHGGGFIPVAANGGEVFCHGNNRNAGGSMGAIPGLDADIETMARTSVAFASRETGRKLDAAGASRYWFIRGVKWIASDPKAWLRLEGKKARIVFSAHFTPLSAFQEFERRRFGGPPRALRLLYYPLWILALAGVVSRRRADRAVPGALHLYAALVLLTPLVFFACTRYSLLLLPPAAIYALAGAEALVRARRRTLSAGLVLAAVIVLAAIDRPAGRERATPFTQLASIRSSEGKSDEALELYSEALRLAPHERVNYENLAVEMEKRGDLKGARRVIEQELERFPESGNTWGYYGTILTALREWPGAEKALREAIRIEPGRSLSHLLLGRVFAETGRWREAEGEFLRAGSLDDADPRPLRALAGLYTGPLEDGAKARSVMAHLRALEKGSSRPDRGEADRR